MLTELRIENFAIIQSLHLEFTSGLIAFTGETGAGKSIILDAIMALLGGRVDNNALRSGAERSLVEGVFRLPAANREAITEILTREDLLDDPDYLTLARELRREGRSTARVNGRSVTLGLLHELGSYLVDIHGQSEHLSLLNVRQHLGLMDRYAGSESLLETYRATYQKLMSLRRELDELRKGEQDATYRMEMLTFQVQEIETAQLHPGEEIELRRERDRLANAENLTSLAQKSLAALDEGSPETPALTDLIGQVVQSLSALARIDPDKAKMMEQAEAAAETLSEISRDLQDYLEQIEFNPRRLEQVEERLELIHGLVRKYGGKRPDGAVQGIEAVLAFEQDARQKLEAITHAGEKIEALEKEEAGLLEKMAGQASELSKKRILASETLEKAVEEELSDLQMKGARFKVDLRQAPAPSGLMLNGQAVAFDQNGIDQVEFLIAPNPGEGFKPLVKTASGGETSRLMLALKNVLAQADYIPTLIFDEIDQGIGGRVGMVVGEKLWKLSQQHQVLCVTHLPQLAVFGGQHFHVHKAVQEGRTLTRVELLEGETRIDELALMLGTVSDANRKSARETLELAHQKMAGQNTSVDHSGLTGNCRTG